MCIFFPFSIPRGLSPHREQQEPHFVSKRPQSAPPPTPAAAAGTSATAAATTIATATAAPAERNDSSPTPAVGKRVYKHMLAESAALSMIFQD